MTLTGTPTLAERFRRGDIFEPDCPSREVMRHVTSRWGVLILIALQDGTMRFSEAQHRFMTATEHHLADHPRLMRTQRAIAESVAEMERTTQVTAWKLCTIERQANTEFDVAHSGLYTAINGSIGRLIDADAPRLPMLRG